MKQCWLLHIFECPNPNADTTKYWWESKATGASTRIDGKTKIKTTLENSLEDFNTRFTLNIWWRNYTSWYPHKQKTQMHTKPWTHVCIKVIFINNKTWDQAKCLTGQWDYESTHAKGFAAKSQAMSSILRTYLEGGGNKHPLVIHSPAHVYYNMWVHIHVHIHMHIYSQDKKLKMSFSK